MSEKIPENDALLQALVQLQTALSPYNIPLILGGGMGIYLLSYYTGDQRSARYPVKPATRSTQDLDFFIGAEL